MRKPLIAGNWKMYKTPKESLAFVEAFLPLVAGHTRDDIAFFPSISSLSYVLEATANTTIAVGAQNMHWLNEGAYTGETSPTMLTAIGCKHVLLGHSEQRLYFGETSERVNLKLKAAINHGFTPVVCVGESLAERESNQTEAILREQVSIALLNITAAEAHRLVIAYEPVWAIGTGLTATPDGAAEAHSIVRDQLAKSIDKETANATRILYGGSVKPDNISSLMAEDGIDGALVGGASLDPISFAKIVKYEA
jgi:triosephosphate isomerase